MDHASRYPRQLCVRPRPRIEASAQQPVRDELLRLMKIKVEAELERMEREAEEAERDDEENVA